MRRSSTYFAACVFSVARMVSAKGGAYEAAGVDRSTAKDAACTRRRRGDGGAAVGCDLNWLNRAHNTTSRNEHGNFDLSHVRVVFPYMASPRFQLVSATTQSTRGSRTCLECFAHARL